MIELYIIELINRLPHYLTLLWALFTMFCIVTRDEFLPRKTNYILFILLIISCIMKFLCPTIEVLK